MKKLLKLALLPLRMLLAILPLMMTLMCVSLSGCTSRAALKPQKLTCEFQESPSAVDLQNPRLSWIDVPSGPEVKGEKQTAWQIRVSSSRKRLRKADLWDSGKCPGEDSYLIHYAGAPLSSGQDCWWQVRVWDSEGRASGWSRPARWGVGIVDASEWEAKWIGAPWEPELGRQDTPDKAYTPAPMFRKEFDLGRKPVSAKAYVTGVGLFQFYLNGEKVGDEELTPNETSWGYRPDLEKQSIPVNGDNFRAYRVLYHCYDITRQLKRGANVTGAIVGNGFYNTNIYWTQSFGAPLFYGQIVIKYSDGSTETVASDESWMAHRSPILKNDMWEGETYDATKEVAGWCSRRLADSDGKCSRRMADSDGKCSRRLADTDGWEPAIVRKGPSGELCGHYFVSDRINETLAPKSITAQEDGSYEVDFGDYITGWVRLKGIKGQAGDTVEVKYLCEERGNGPQIYIVNGRGDEEYAPRFTWFAFDKVQVKGFPDLKPENIRAEAVYSDIETTGKFECSNELFNRINHIWWRSQTDNMHLGTASDCPHREKGPYTGDGELSCVTVMNNFDAASFYTKWLRDMSDCQDVETGYVPNGAPWHKGCGGGVGWGAAMDIIPWEFYLHYGDRELLSNYYFQMKEYVRWMDSWRTESGTMKQLAPTREKSIYWMNLGDWLPPFELPDDELVHTFLYWRCSDIVARAAAALGQQDEAAHYKAQTEEIAAAFHKRFYDADAATYGDYGSNIFALKIGVPAECRDAVIETLKAEIARYDGHLNTGIIGTRFFFEVLAENGLNELAFEAMNKRDFPGFGWWIEQGAYTTWENWNGKDSRNHPMFGGGINWFYCKLAGMEADEAAPGYKHIIFRPMPCGDVTWASYSTRTPYGDAGIRWDLDGSAFKMTVTVPVGSTATVMVPGTDGYDSQEVGSGTYTFTSTI